MTAEKLDELAIDTIRTLSIDAVQQAQPGVAQRALMVDAPNSQREVILIASGSEVSLAVDARETLSSENIRSRVISMPSRENFEHQPKAYRGSVHAGSTE